MRIRWRPDTTGRAVMLGAAIALVLEALHLLASLMFLDVPTPVALFERSNYRIAMIVSLLTGFSVVALAYGVRAERREIETRARELRWSDDQLAAVLVREAPRPRSALPWILVLALLGTLLITGEDTSRPFAFSDDPWTFSIAWATAANVLLFGLMGALAYVTWSWQRLEQTLDRSPATFDLLDPAPNRRAAATGLRRSFFWIVGSSIASPIFVDLGFSWMTGVILVLTLAVGTVLFVTPLWKLARRIRGEKERELARLRDRIRSVRDALLSSPAPAGGSGPGELVALLAYERRICEIRAWAIDFSQVLRFVMLVILAIGSWLGGAIVDHVVDRVLR